MKKIKKLKKLIAELTKQLEELENNDEPKIKGVTIQFNGMAKLTLDELFGSNIPEEVSKESVALYLKNEIANNYHDCVVTWLDDWNLGDNLQYSFTIDYEEE